MNPKDAKILIVATIGTEIPKQCTAPFLFALEAAGLGADVSIVFVAQGPVLLKQGVADNLYPKEGDRALSELIEETLKAGVRFQACGAALDLNSMAPEDLIEDVEDLVGPSFLITKGLEADLVLSF